MKIFEIAVTVILTVTIATGAESPNFKIIEAGWKATSSEGCISPVYKIKGCT